MKVLKEEHMIEQRLISSVSTEENWIAALQMDMKIRATGSMLLGITHHHKHYNNLVNSFIKEGLVKKEQFEEVITYNIN